MARATEQKLGDLHGIVAEGLSEILAEREDVMDYDDEGNEIPTGKTRLVAAPAYFNTAITFLKQNNITADVKTNTNMNKIAEMVGNKQKSSRLGDAKNAANEVH